HTRSYGDWSSDVCSSDLQGSRFWAGVMILLGVLFFTACHHTSPVVNKPPVSEPPPPVPSPSIVLRANPGTIDTGASTTLQWTARSEERRVGKECRSRWAR